MAALTLLVAPAASAQQQGTIQLSTETQVVQGDPQRRSTEHQWEPDFGVLWSQPGSKYGEFTLELRGSRRGNELHLGRTWLALHDAKARGVTWTFEGGDLYTSPAFGDYQFSNLSAPAITFTGGAVSAHTSRATLQLTAGKTTALRNIFGTDPDSLGQSLALARGTFAKSARLQVNARASRVRTADIGEFTRTIDASDQAGAGARFIPIPAIQFVADASYVRYRATGGTETVQDLSYLAGTSLLLPRGWVQINASRFSPGDLPVLNASLLDRDGVFAAGEHDLVSRVRLFGGWETLGTNINPSGSALLRPQATTTRQFAGARMRLAPRTSLTVRIEDGDRLSRPLRPGLPIIQGLPSTSDTGAFTTELQTSAGRLTAFARFTKRDNVDSTFASSTYTQRDGAANLFVNVSPKTQLFGVVTVTNNRIATGAANSFLQVSAGGQQQVFHRGLWLRLEGTTSRNYDLAAGLLVPRDAIGIGLNGQLGPHTTIGLNVNMDRAPAGFPSDDNTWLSRTTVRIVHTIPTGSVRVAGTSGTASRPSRGSGSILGSVFADWNGNGQPDPGEELLAGIPIALGSLSHVATGRDGQFAFMNVPAGMQSVMLDLNALPVDFDAPAGSQVTLELSRGDAKRVAFGLIPLGAVRGRVFEDVNRNGQVDAGEPPVESAVVVLDGGQRSELARKGQFRFDAVRAGDHRVQLLKESLPEGSTIVGEADRAAPITRERSQVELTYLVTIEKRPEVRKVFPARGGGAGAAPPPSAPGAGRGRSGGPARSSDARPTPVRPIPSSPAGPAREMPAAAPIGLYTIQIAALTDAGNARAIVKELTRLGFAAYLLEPAPDGADTLYRVRVGRYASRVSAQRTVTKLEGILGLKLWITRAR